MTFFCFSGRDVVVVNDGLSMFSLLDLCDCPDHDDNEDACGDVDDGERP